VGAMILGLVHLIPNRISNVNRPTGFLKVHVSSELKQFLLMLPYRNTCTILLISTPLRQRDQCNAMSSTSWLFQRKPQISDL